MFSFFKRKRQMKKNGKQEKNSSDYSNSHTPGYISKSISTNLDLMKQRTGNSSDITIRTLKIGQNPEIKTIIVYVQGLVDTSTVHDFLIESMMNNPNLEEKLTPQKALDVISDDVFSVGDVKTVKDWENLFLSMLSGDTVIFIDGASEALIASTKGGEKRSIQEPTTQPAIRGSKEGFTESIATNIAMLRRIINSPDLWTESMKIGTRTKTDVSIMYINGIANKKIVGEVRERLQRINIDSILESGYIEELIEDETMTPFPTLHHTERPDMVAGNLLEGSVAIFVNGTPFVLLAPALFIQFFQSVDDYYNNFFIGTATRFLRIFIFFISLIGPAGYVAATTFSQEMIPTELLIILAAQRETVPFPAFVEAFVMEVTFEVLREASIRMPKAIGPTMSIVGALVIGQAAVQAGIVSPAMVIVVSITAIASFATPSYAMATSARILRFGFMISAALFGFYGIHLVFFMLFVHLCSLRSFGVPYMSPLAPVTPAEVGDTIARRPWWAFKERPRLISSENKVREGENQKPQPPGTRVMVNTNMKKGEENES